MGTGNTMKAATEGSITICLRALEQGSDEAGHQLWEHYYHRMVRLARHRLGHVAGRIADEEDVAISAFDSFCGGLQHGRFPHMQDRNDLWAMLIVITVRKAVDQIQYEGRQKRGGGLSRPHNDAAALQELLSREPSPETTSVMTEECDRLLALLDKDMKQLVLLKLEGHNNIECAKLMGCARATVQRMLKLIRQTWQLEIPE